MSLQTRTKAQVMEGSAFFIEPDSGQAWEAEEEVDHHVEDQNLILLKANALASENDLKQAIDWFSMAARYGPVQPEQLSTFVDCILRNFKRKAEGTSTLPGQAEETARRTVDNVFDCPNCGCFLGEAVTVACGHSYCRRCIELRLLSKCKLCAEPLARDNLESKATVILCGLFEKWFPEDMKKSKDVAEVGRLCRVKRNEEAVSLATEILSDADPEMAAVVQLARAEAHVALKQYHLALQDTDVCPQSSCAAEALYRKAKVLHKMGKIDEALQVFLQCLAVDEGFPSAKRQVEKILCDLLSPASENVKIGLRKTAQNTSSHNRSKNAATSGPTEMNPPQSPVQRRHPQQVRAASAHHHQDETEGETHSKRWESLERPGLNRAHSLRLHGSGCGEEGLKRVCSAPQLGDQEKGSLLKRKLSVSDCEPCVVDRASTKHKRQGLTVGAKQQAAKLKVCRAVPADLLDSSDLECSLCMRLMYEPVTTPCGHTFCKNCLERCLDHTPQCPLCKESLREYLATRKYMVTQILNTLIKQYWSEEYAERTRTHLEETRELSDLTKNVPIFVCTMAYPTVPCPLHVFEPRYRLMIRRCMNTGTRQFGMCINDPHKGFADHGCMLIIRSVHFLPDGRSVVDTIGGKRFRVLSRGMKDGYSIADIEHLEDTRVEDEEELLRLQELHDSVYDQAKVWFQNLKIRFHNQILQHFGPMPEREADIQATPNGPACCWWLLAVLPVDPLYQLSILSMCSLRERLVKIQHILTYLQSIPSD